MAIIGIETVLYGVNDVAECTRYFVDFGLPLLDKSASHAHRAKMKRKHFPKKNSQPGQKYRSSRLATRSSSTENLLPTHHAASATPRVSSSTNV